MYPRAIHKGAASNNDQNSEADRGSKPLGIFNPAKYPTKTLSGWLSKASGTAAATQVTPYTAKKTHKGNSANAVGKLSRFAVMAGRAPNRRGNAVHAHPR